MTRENPLVSIIVRTKDRPKLVKNTLKSIVQQSYRPIEVVLVNDGGCELDIEELKGILTNVSFNYIRLEQNTGRAHAGNVGIENAVGYYIGFLDDDDEFYPEHLQVLTDRMTRISSQIAYTDAEIVYTSITKEDDIVEQSKYVMYSHDFSPEMLLVQNYIPFMCLLFHKAVFDDERFDESFEIFEDWKLLINLSQKHWFDHIKKVTAKYIQWSNVLQINRKALLEDFSKDAYKKILDQNIDRITPEVLYVYCVNNSTERINLINELILARSEKIKIESEKLRIDSEKQGTESEMQGTESEKIKIESEKLRIDSENDRLLQELMGLQNYLMELSNSLSWKLILRYRRFKDKIAPGGSRRRLFYDLLLKSIKVVEYEGIKGFMSRVKRRNYFNLSYLKSKLRFNKNKTAQVTIDSKTSEKHKFIQKPVYIIMPVYNGYEHLKNCIDSLFKNTDFSFNTLIIIDDKSTDRRIKNYLEKIKENINSRKIKILYNHTNLGFAKTINRGLRLSPHDVIILNSDTITTKNWVTKLQRAAFSKPRIATVTPLSNYVTINGIPKPFKYNSIPNGMDIDNFAEFLEKISLRYYPEIPAGVGFCMYIKKEIFEEVGYFDEEKFGRGYAEDTDFCMRALKKGYIHVIDDNTYIYHIGGVSFESVKDPKILKEKNLMIERNLETLETLHPEYMILVEKALHENLAPVHELINLRIRLKEKNA